MTFRVLALAILLGFFTTHITQAQTQGDLPIGVTNYVVHQHKNGANPVFLKKVITFHLVILNHRDEVIRSTYPNNPVQKDISPYQSAEEYDYDSRGYLHDMLRMLAEGDSATFYVDSDLYFASIDRPRPSSIPQGTEMRFIIKVLKAQEWNVLEKELEAQKYEQTQKDLELMREYVVQNRFNMVRKASSGLWMVVEVEGVGEVPKEDDLVVIHLVGKTLDGQVIESTYEKGEPIEFPVGNSMMIAGIEQGIKMMKEGGKSLFIIPSTLAYGEKGVEGYIPPNMPLVVEMELLAIKEEKVQIVDPQSISQGDGNNTAKTSENDLEVIDEKIEKSEEEDKKKTNVTTEGYQDYPEKYKKNQYKKTKIPKTPKPPKHR